MTLQRLLSYARRCADDFGMIEDGDKIAVGVSGGKDSLSLLTALSELRRFYPKRYEIAAFSVSLGLKPVSEFDPVREYCEKLGVPYEVVRTEIGPIVFRDRKEKNPCALCAKMRKGNLNTAAKAAGCNKIAYGHNRDDVTETLFMALFYEGRIYTFRPVTHWDITGLTLIRPLLYVPERDLRAFAKSARLPVVDNCCHISGRTKRGETKAFIAEMRGRYARFDEKVFGAVKRSNIDGWCVNDGGGISRKTEAGADGGAAGEG
jgi:tRNA(Ile)-lysidine synthase TilS/MesJ